MFACSRSDIHNAVRRSHGILIVLYHQNCIAQVTKVGQGCQQLVIVALMQTNARFIQNICHAHQAGADLGCQADSLCLTAGQSTSSPGQRQVFQSYI